MKKVITFFIALIIGCVSLAQQPETVYGLAKERREESWYLTQLQLWKKEVDANNKNANAWYNYYKASRALRNVAAKEEDKQTYRDLCAKIVNDAYTALPESFEANHMKWSEGGNNPSLFPFLKKAYDINPNDSRTYEELATYYETQHNKAEYQKACKLMYTSNLMHPSMLSVAYNMLAEAEPNALLFTAGDNDTYAAWVVQESKNFRKDVRVINLYLLMMDDYRNQLFKELGIPELKIDTNFPSQEKWDEGQQKILEHVLKNSEKHPVHIAVCASYAFSEKWSDKLYLTGLTYHYSAEKFDNMALILRNYEKRFLLDHLKQQFTFSISEKTADEFNGCYLPSMVQLYSHFLITEQHERATELRTLMVDLSKKAGEEEQWRKILEELDPQK